MAIDAGDKHAEQRRVRRHRAAGRRDLRLGGQRSADRQRRDDREEPADQHRDALRGRVPLRARALIGERRAVVVAGRGEVVEHLRQAVRARLGRSLRSSSSTDAAANVSTANGIARMYSVTSFISDAWIFLPRYSGVRPTIRPAMNTASRALTSIPIKPDADTARRDLAELHVRHRRRAAERRERVVHAVHRAGRRAGRRRRRRQPQAGGAEADLLALHVAARLRGRDRLIDAERGQQRVAVLLGEHGEAGEQHEDARHHGEQHPALSLVADHLAERHDERERDQQEREDLEQVR